MLKTKEAVQTAFQIFGDLFPSATFQEPRLEEIDRSEDDQRWKITLSYKNPDLYDEISARNAETKVMPLTFNTRSEPVHTRHYKLIIISSEDGGLVGIKNV